MPVEVAIFLKGATIAYSTAKNFGIIKDKLAMKLDKLSRSKFEAGITALKQATSSK